MLPAVPPLARKALSLVALVGLLAVGARFFGLFGSAPVPVEIHYLLGDPPVCSALEVAIAPGGEGDVAARFETSLVGPDVVHRPRLPGGAEILTITLVQPGGARRTVTRTIEAERGAVIRLDLTHEGGS
jgi:hypothetical protein